MSEPLVVDIGAAMKTLEDNPDLVTKMNELIFGKLVAEQLAAMEAEVAKLRAELAESKAAHAECIKRNIGLAARTCNQIGFTYEPTGERVTIYSGADRSIDIIASHPEILRSFVAAKGEPLDFGDSTHAALKEAAA